MPAAASGAASPGPSVDASATPAIPPNLDPLDGRRVLMTTGCRDCDDLPKQADAGSIVRDAEGEFQIMHNGLQVVAGGYCGAWMTEIIRRLRGHHEPQEERVFHELLARCRPGSTMLELGSGWSYYSMWYARRVPAAQLFCVEPDPVNLETGRRNFRRNGIEGRFVRASVGRTSHAGRPFPCESGQSPLTPQVTVDELLESERIPRVEMLLADIQGAELEMLAGAAASIAAGRVRFLVVATHHHAISSDPLMHQRCLTWVRDHGGRVLTAFNVVEGYSGDGLIAASFDPADAALPEIVVSRNHPTNSLFRELEYDLNDALVRLERYQRWFNWLPWNWRRRKRRR